VPSAAAVPDLSGNCCSSFADSVHVNHLEALEGLNNACAAMVKVL